MVLSYDPTNSWKPVEVPSSKSIANRLLLLQHLYFPGMEILNLSQSTDTQTLEHQLDALRSKSEHQLDAKDGGTTFRFLLAAMALADHNLSLTGTERLLERPHHPLVHSLVDAGFVVQTLANKKIYTRPVDSYVIQEYWKVKIDKSSQFASALSMIAPSVGRPIQIKLEGEPVSLGYLDLTLGLMKSLGIDIRREEDTILCKPFKPVTEPITVSVESDWSSISYFVAIAMVTRRDICILNVAHASNQPDAAILDFASLFNVNYNFENGHLYIYGSSLKEIPHSIRRDYTNCPDIVLTELVCAKILGVELNASGIDHLTYKESDRWTTIHRELGKVGDDLPVFDTHDDHRIAMSLSVLAFIKPIQINNPDVVSKSFPDFWVELKKLGIQIQ